MPCSSWLRHTVSVRNVQVPGNNASCRSAFFWYSADARSRVRAANPDFGVGDIAKELGRQWSEASEDTREERISSVETANDAFMLKVFNCQEH